MTEDHNPYLPTRPAPAPAFTLEHAPSQRGEPLLRDEPRFVVPGYEVLELLGVGGSGEVWRGRHRRSGEAVAIKFVAIADAAAQEHAQREATMLAALRHPYLIALRETVPLRAAMALVLELAERGSLAQLLDVRASLTPGEVITTVAPVAAAVAHAHASGVVHGDITAANVVYSARGDALLTDLGTARLVGDRHLPTTAEDVYALGALAFRCLAGAGPGTALQQRQALVAMPAELAEAVLRALSSEPAARPSAAEFALALRAAGTPAAVQFPESGAGLSGPARPAPTRRVAVPPRPVVTSRWRRRFVRRTDGSSAGHVPAS